MQTTLAKIRVQSITPMLSANREAQHNEHHAVIDTFKTLAEKMGKEVVIRSEAEAQMEDMREVDCVVALGGDHTFLRASGLIWNR